MISKGDKAYLEAEAKPAKYKDSRFDRLKTIYRNDQTQTVILPTPEKVRNIYGGDVEWVDSPNQDRASVGIIYVQTLDGKAGLKAPWEARGGLTDWYHFREILRFNVDAVAAANNLRRGNDDERPLLLSFYDPELVAYRQKTLKKSRHPLGVIVTGSGLIRNGLDHPVFQSEGRTVVFTSEEGAPNLESLAEENPNVSVETIGETPRELDMEEMLRILKSKYDVKRLLALGGPGFSTELIMQGCVDNYFINMSAALSGNQAVRSFFSDETGVHPPSELELVSLKMPKVSKSEEGKYTLYMHWTPKR